MSRIFQSSIKWNEWNNNTMIHEICNYYTNRFIDNEWKKKRKSGKNK